MSYQKWISIAADVVRLVVGSIVLVVTFYDHSTQGWIGTAVGVICLAQVGRPNGH